jgi:PAS domain S-box-containing protein
LKSIWRSFLGPAVNLLNRLSYPQKFTLLSCLLLLPLAVALPPLLTEIESQIAFAESERQGLELLRPIQAYSTEVLRNPKQGSNTASARNKWLQLSEAGQEAGGAFNTTGSIQRLRNITPAQDAASIKTVIQDQFDQLRNKIGSESNLILDPLTASYYLADALLNKFPRIETDLAIINHLIISQNKNPSEEARRTLSSTLHELRDLSSSLEANLQVAFHANKDNNQLELALKQPLARLNQQITGQILPLERKAFSATASELSSLAEHSQASLISADLLWRRTADELDRLLQQRIHNLRTRQWSLALVVLITLGLALYLFIGFYRSIMQTVDSLRQASLRMVDGIQSERVELQTADEMAMVVKSFNSVADALRLAEANYRGIVENSLEGIFQSDVEGHFTMANPMLASLLGYDSAEDLIASVSDISRDVYVCPSRRLAFLEAIEQHGRVLGFESEVRRKDGTIIWISEAVRAINQNGCKLSGFEGTVIDITRKKQDAAEIERLTNELKDENLRMGAELSVTRRLQDMLMPSSGELVAMPELDIAGFMEPAAEVGGDYYDIQQHNGSVRISIGDVTGHGLESSLVMIMAQTAVRTLLSNGETDPARLLNAVNRTIYDNTRRMGSTKNMTLSLLQYESGVLRLSGQHEELIIVRADGTVEQIDTFDLGFPLGIESDIAQFVREEQLRFEPGDVAVLYTDGITEAMNPAKEQYGIERMVDVITAYRNQTAMEICQGIISDLRTWIHTQRVFDDITLLVMRQHQ